MKTPRRSLPRAVRHVCLVAGLGSLLGGCIFTPTRTLEEPQGVAMPTQPNPAAERLEPLETRRVELSSPDNDLVGETQVIFARYENTFSAIGRAYDLGYEELRRANPGVDQWLPGEGTPIYLPTESVLPDAPREGIVINVPAMRLYYYAQEKPEVEGAPATLTVTTHPIGIGAEGWATPFGEGKVTQKARDPVWYVPASVRKEHAERGDPLPSIVKPGPDNPLGKFALALSLPGYLIHGTNKPSGVGMRVSHGCIRLYPEDIEALFPRVPKGTPVRLVNQPVLAAWSGGQLYLEVHPPLVEEEHDLVAEANVALRRALERADVAPESVAIDPAFVEKIVSEQRGMPLPVLRSDRSIEQYLASAARIVENTVPQVLAEERAQAVETVTSAVAAER